MNDALRMQVSAFVDGELPDAESELLMRRLSQDRLLRDLVADYLRIGRLMRRDRTVPGIEGLRGRIQAALGEQPAAASNEAAPPRNRFLRPVAGVAVASVVATLALLGLRQVEVPETAPTTASQQLPAAASGDTPGYTEPQPGEVMNSRPSEMLMQYYLSHGATSRDLGANGILTRLVTLELREGELVEADSAAGEGEQEDEGEASDSPAGAVRDRIDPEQ